MTEKRRRTAAILVRLFPAERAEIRKAARRDGGTVVNWVRMTLLEKARKT